MELIRGKTLRKILQDGPPRSRRLDMLMQLAAAMRVAHASGPIRHDLKPSNIMLDDNGRYRILDFGLALVNDTEVTTSTNQLDPQERLPIWHRNV
jgi:serine/threonine-protein kinase